LDLQIDVCTMRGKIVRPKLKRQVPKNAGKVFEGVIFDVYQWEQKMFDGSFETFEMLKRPDTVDIVPVTKDKKIIVLEQEQPGREKFIGIPAGRIDKGEDPISAAERELLEETGFKARKFELLYTDQPAGSLIDWVLYGFVARDCEEIGGQRLDSGEKMRLKFLSFDEFVKLASSSEFRDVELSLEVLRAGNNSVTFNKFKKRILQ